jgi:DNA polymerase III sliding clamp (beta) subunit (PCNA family)
MGNILKAADLRRILTVAKTFASTDATVPAINAVRIEASESTIIAVATDRFVLGVVPADWTGEAFIATLDGTHVETLIKMAKTAKRDAQWREVTVEIVDTVHKYEPTVIEFRFTTGESLSVRTSDHDFPKFRQLVPSAILLETENVTPTKLASFDASKLAQFAKVPGHERMSMWIRGTKPTVVRIGDDFIGLIMPVRTPDGTEYVWPAWLDAA